MSKTIHQGHNVKRIREMLGIKQDALAAELGDDWNQKKISLLEQKEVIEPDILKQVADVLKVTPDAIKNFDEEHAVNIISNTFKDSSFANNTLNNNPTFNINPIEKWIEAIDENKRLYERLIKEKDEKINLLQSLRDEKQKK